MKIMKQGLLVVLLGLISSVGWAFSLERYVEGTHYTRMEGADYQPKTVIEFFSFGCPHCFHLEPLMVAWLGTKPADVAFSRVPATWNAKFLTLGRLYYVIEALGIEQKAMPAAFEAIHTHGKDIKTRQDAQALLATLGVSEADFSKAWDDKGVTAKLDASSRQFAAYQIRGVPAIVVNGQYQTSVSMAGSQEELIEVINFLLSK